MMGVKAMANDRICQMVVQNSDGEDYVLVFHTVSAYFEIKAIDEDGNTTASIDLDYDEARALAFALSHLVQWHCPVNDAAPQAIRAS